jgi:peptidoglycan-associated lipoprotein
VAVVVEAAPRTLGTVWFAFGSAALGADALATLDRIAATLPADPAVQLRIEGHADRRGPVGYNQRLSERRARAVRDALVRRGVSVDRMDVAGFGVTRPIDPARTAAAYARNRRAECLAVPAPALPVAGN